MATLKQGELFKPELVKQMFSKVQGRSTLAKLSNQTPIPFTGVEQFIFNLDGNAEIVGEVVSNLQTAQPLLQKLSNRLNLYIKHVSQMNLNTHQKKNKLSISVFLLMDLLRKLQKDLTLLRFMALNQNHQQMHHSEILIHSMEL